MKEIGGGKVVLKILFLPDISHDSKIYIKDAYADCRSFNTIQKRNFHDHEITQSRIFHSIPTYSFTLDSRNLQNNY